MVVKRGGCFIRRRDTVLEYIKNLSISNSLVLYLTDESIEINVRYNKIKINFVISVIGKENLKGWFWFDIWPFRIVCQVYWIAVFPPPAFPFQAAKAIFMFSKKRAKNENLIILLRFFEGVVGTDGMLCFHVTHSIYKNRSNAASLTVAVIWS